MEKKYTERIDIPCYMYDRRELLRPEAFMNIAQELAGKGAEQGGFSDRELKKHNLVWIIARMKVRFANMPKRSESFTAETWHRGVDGIFFIRDYRLVDNRGNAAVNSTSSWIVMNLTDRKALRSDRIEGDLIPQKPQCTEAAIEETVPRIVVPRDMVLKKMGEHKVVYSDLDYNGHANNAKYFSWVLDCLKEPLMNGPILKEMTINYNSEALLSETVEILGAECGSGYLIEGRSSGRQIFVCTVEY